MNQLTKAERKQPLEERLATVYPMACPLLTVLIAVDANVLMDLAAADDSITRKNGSVSRI